MQNQKALPAYGGFQGFENENYRQDILSGRKFSEHNKKLRESHFHGNSISIADGFSKAEYTTTTGASYKSGGLTYSRHERPTSKEKPNIRETILDNEGKPLKSKPLPDVAGQGSHYGIPSPPYHILNGVGQPIVGVGPHFSQHGSRQPIHTFPDDAQKQALREGPTSPPHLRPSGPRHAAWYAPSAPNPPSYLLTCPRHSLLPHPPPGPMDRQYTTSDEAMKPPGAGMGEAPAAPVYSQGAKEYDSYSELKNDRTRNVRPITGPLERSEGPQTSSQSYGWKTDTNIPIQGRNSRPMCRETRFAQSMLVGARHKGGYSGQGTL
ncbi:hypothetical protein CYMTET_41909 [Cymbomonas tetramitiformis]|uniref:Uncharacterized protein n=1 Tax=Cymbomonas tetramitiformis TaxID=36881 RepID=A0AAE0F262_9CHLO|nr:hypothetical protein CYMTET_41909 [Cymbomonas tetramitiformis]